MGDIAPVKNPFSDVIIDPMPSNKMESLPSANKARDREPVIPVSCVNLSSDDKDLAQKLSFVYHLNVSQAVFTCKSLQHFTVFCKMFEIGCENLPFITCS